MYSIGGGGMSGLPGAGMGSGAPSSGGCVSGAVQTVRRNPWLLVVPLLFLFVLWSRLDGSDSSPMAFFGRGSPSSHELGGSGASAERFPFADPLTLAHGGTALNEASRSPGNSNNNCDGATNSNGQISLLRREQLAEIDRLARYNAHSTQYEFAVVADKDKLSAGHGGPDGQQQRGKVWHSILRNGTLFRDPVRNIYSIRWGPDVELRSGLNEAGRGMELSALAWYTDRLLTVDDRTGAIFAVENNEVHPVAVLADGDGYTGKGFKAEWMTRKDGYLYVGSVGKEWTTQKGEVLNNNPQWVKVLDPRLRVTQENWHSRYEALRKATDTQYPGYLMHEAVGWHESERKWYFLPRRVSHEPYDDELDERRCSNIALVANEDFSEVTVREVGLLTPTRGFSAFKWIPGRPNEILALKTDEWGGTTQTYIAVYDLNTGATLMPETLLPGDIKFEGVEFF
mmetsp:Transcript_16702/g.49968  ORF Transcript_16702/g.49968 Transcript_16702/m.49968 type:complete len:455 (-) Transcript_16702:46-1410(-)